MSVYFSSFTIVIFVNYTSEFCSLFKATMYTARVINRRSCLLLSGRGKCCYVTSNQLRLPKIVRLASLLYSDKPYND